jgi:hypothetical protein
MSKPVAGYFQRLAQRSGLTAERPATATMSRSSAASAAAGEALDVDEVRQVFQPVAQATSTSLNPSGTAPTDQQNVGVSIHNGAQVTPEADPEFSPSGHSVATVSDATDNNTAIEQPLTGRMTQSHQEASPPGIDSPKIQIEAVNAQQPASLSAELINEFVPPASDSSANHKPHQGSESVPEQLIEPFSGRGLPAAMLPDFIPGQVSDKAREATPTTDTHTMFKTIPQQIEQGHLAAPASVAPEFQTQEVTIGSRRNPVMQVNNVPMHERLEQTQTRKDTAAHISIGQINIDVHTPASVASVETTTKPQTVLPTSRPRRLERPTNLHRYYLRGM